MTKQLFTSRLGATAMTIHLLCSAAIAQSTDDIPEIVVTAKGGQNISEVLPTSHVLTSADIEAAQVKDIPALIDQLTGVSVSDTGGRGSVTGVFLRGVSSSQTIVLIDGVRVGSATLGAAALNAYPIEAIERIEVVKGPLSGIYGADAVGGVIHLFTRKGSDGNGSASLTIGSDSLQEYGLAFNGGNDKHSFRVSAHFEDTDGIDRTSIVSGGNDDVDGFAQTAFSFSGKTTMSDRTIANLSILYADSSVDFDNTFGDDIGNVIDSKTFSSALNISSQINENLLWSTTLGINEDESKTTSSFPSTFTTDRDSLGTELAMQLSEQTALTLGADYYQEDISSSTNFPVTNRDNTGAFAQIKTSSGNFGLLATLRFDDNSAYGDDANTSLAINYDFDDNTRLVASYGTAFVAPSFNFLFFPFFGNPNLLPEESESVELSLIGHNANFDWRISAYKTDIENLFSFDPATFLAANVGEAEIKGIEISVNTRVYDWMLAVNVDFLSAEDKDTGIELDDRAEQTIALTASRSFGKFDLRVNLKSESDRFDNRGTKLPSYTLFDISGRYSINENFSVLGSVENIFDKDYTVNLIGLNDRFNTEGLQAKITLKYDF